MKSTLQAGVSKTRRIEVDKPRTIDFMGEALRVYATPELVRDIEITCRELLLEHSDAGEDSVGIRVELDHTGATLLGQWVEITAKVTAVEGPAVTFEVSAKDSVEPVGKGIHKRFAVPVAKLEAKLKGKAAKL